MFGYVLAGGASSRFGRDKALVELAGKPMLARMLGIVDHAVSREEVACSALVIGAAERYDTVWARCVEDRWPGEGPLGGIVTALLHTQEKNPVCEWNMIVGCDMPFLTREWLAFLVRRALESSAEVVVPQSRQGLEPLCACWHTSVAGKLKAVFDSGVRKVTEAMKQCDMEVLDEAHWKRFDSDERLFWNMNTPADYDEAKRILEAKQA